MLILIISLNPNSVYYESKSKSIVISSSSTIQQVNIYDIQGKKIEERNNILINKHLKFYKKGIYIIQIISNTNSFSKRIVIP